MNFIETYENAFVDNFCDDAIKYFESSGSKNPGMIFDGNKQIINKNIKSSTDLTLYFSQKTLVSSRVFDCLNKYFYKYLQKYKDVQSLMELSLNDNFNIQRYYPGEGYTSIHCEHNSKTCTTVFGWMIYLNTVNDGGTEFTNYDTILDCKKGTLVIWPAYWTHSHRGVVSKTKTKYIATGWISFL